MGLRARQTWAVLPACVALDAGGICSEPHTAEINTIFHNFLPLSLKMATKVGLWEEIKITKW